MLFSALFGRIESQKAPRILADSGAVTDYQGVDMTIVTEMTAEEVESFWAKAKKAEGCWTWTGTDDGGGYGRVRIGGMPMRPHRVAFELANGAIPDGMVIDHACINRICVNPSHLRLATRKQNAENLALSRANNTSGTRGVTLHKPSGKWRGKVMHNGKNYQAGYFHEKSDAEAAVVALRNKLFTHNETDRNAA